MMLRKALKALAVLAVAGLFLGVLVILGRHALAQLHSHDRYFFPFADIDCQPPSHLSRPQFLDEVQYVSGMPDRLPLLEEDLARRLSEAFVLHPWVESVERVVIGPGHKIEVRLVARQAVLGVRYGDKVRAVDRHGVLLPGDGKVDGLPRYAGKARAHSGPAGTSWGDKAVEEEARRAGEKKK
jgi:hypothetical protein